MNDAFSTTPETDPIRKAILSAMDRMLSGSPKRSTGHLNVSQLAVEADVKRWQLTHRHTDLRDLFQARARQAENSRGTQWRAVEERDDLRLRHAELQRHCAELEERVQTYAVVINLMALEYDAVAEQTAGSARVLPLPSGGRLALERAGSRPGRHQPPGDAGQPTDFEERGRGA
ncbi:hypothetical protein [Streptomyces coelicoflavus]|uniref:hypothetical protein n=1 Tax=Streptomyces coelicoflavus TaxID=285562 RepID=UPI002E261462